jgi:hypothetical protein
MYRTLATRLVMPAGRSVLAGQRSTWCRFFSAVERVARIRASEG